MNNRCDLKSFVNSSIHCTIHFRSNYGVNQWKDFKYFMKELSHSRFGLIGEVTYEFICEEAIEKCDISILLHTNNIDIFRNSNSKINLFRRSNRKRKFDVNDQNNGVQISNAVNNILNNNEDNNGYNNEDVKSFQSSSGGYDYYIGMAILTEMKDSQILYIQFMCTLQNKGLGTFLMSKIKSLGKYLKAKYPSDFNYISLSSLCNTINFYRKNEFKHYNPPNSSQEAEEVKIVAETLRNTKFGSKEDALENEKMKQLIKILISHDLNFNKKKTDDLEIAVEEGLHMTWEILNE